MATNRWARATRSLSLSEGFVRFDFQLLKDAKRRSNMGAWLRGSCANWKDSRPTPRDRNPSILGLAHDPTNRPGAIVKEGAGIAPALHNRSYRRFGEGLLGVRRYPPEQLDHHRPGRRWNDVSCVLACILGDLTPEIDALLLHHIVVAEQPTSICHK